MRLLTAHSMAPSQRTCAAVVDHLVEQGMVDDARRYAGARREARPLGVL
jgi:hypothetical protein